MGHGVAGTEERAAQVHVHDTVEVFRLHPDQELVFVDASIVDQDVDSTEMLHQVLYDGFGFVFLGNVASHQKGLPAGLLDGVNDHGRGVGTGVIIDADPSTSLGKTGGDNGADTPGCPGDQCYFAAEVDAGHRAALPARAAAVGLLRGILVYAFEVRAHDVDKTQLNIADGGADGGGDLIRPAGTVAENHRPFDPE